MISTVVIVGFTVAIVVDDGIEVVSVIVEVPSTVLEVVCTIPLVELLARSVMLVITSLEVE